MTEIRLAPSVLSCDFGRLGEEIAAVEAAGADWIHLDVMDGRFVPNLTIGPIVVEAARRATGLPLDVHLMIEEPERYVEAFAAAGATLLTVHAEATRSLWRTIQRMRELGVRPAVALSPASPIELVTHVLDEVDMVLLMTVEPGFGGQRFIPAMLSKIERLRALAARRSRHLLIEVDGGIDSRTAGGVVAAGADVLVAGTAVFGADDYAESIAALRRAARQGE